MKLYKCIKTFEFNNDYESVCRDNPPIITVRKKSIWSIPELDDYREVGGDIRLEDADGNWLEISDYTFKKYFKPLFKIRKCILRRWHKK